MRTVVCLLLLLLCSLIGQQVNAQDGSLEQRQPLELVFADSIVPQDKHEAMFTTGGWYFRNGTLRHRSLTQKVEWGISDRLQVSTTVNLINSSNSAGSTEQFQTGMGDFEIGARYTWEKLGGSRLTHLAVALEAGFPTGDPRRGLGEGTYSVSPSVLFSRELRQGKYQLFTTDGIEFITKRRRLDPSEEVPRNSIFSNSGLSARVGRGWVVGEISVSSNRWNGGSETQVALTPAYVRRLARRTELLIAVPIGLTSSTDRVGGVIKFTFELGGEGK